MGRASARRLLGMNPVGLKGRPTGSGSVGLKADPQGRARSRGSGFSPTRFQAAKSSRRLVGRASARRRLRGKRRRPEARPTGGAVGLKADPQGTARALWVGLQPDARRRSVGLKADPQMPCGSGFSPTPFAPMREPRRPEGRPTGRAPLWVGLQPDVFSSDAANPVGLKADPQGSARRCGSGFSPTLSPWRTRRPEGRPTGMPLWVGLQPDAFPRCGEPRRPEGRPTGWQRKLWVGLQPDAFRPMRESRRPEGRPTEARVSCGSGFSPTLPDFRMPPRSFGRMRHDTHAAMLARSLRATRQCRTTNCAAAARRSKVRSICSPRRPAVGARYSPTFLRHA